MSGLRKVMVYGKVHRQGNGTPVTIGGVIVKFMEDEILNVLRVFTSGHESIKSRVVEGGKEEEVVSCMRECQEQMRQDSQIHLCVFQPLYRLSLILREEGLHFG